MKISFKKELLQEQLQKTLISNIRSSLPILNNIFISVEGEYLITISTDLNISVKYKQRLDIEREGSILLPGKKLIEIINNLEGDIVMEVDKERAEIKEKNSIFHLFGMSPLEFPQLKEPEWNIEFNILSNILQDMIKMVIFSASSDETLIPYCGIYLELEGDKIKMVTSDKYRLSVIEQKIENREQRINIIIPIRAVYEIIKILKGVNGDIKICISNKEIGIETDNIIFISRLLEGKFPDYNKIIPKELREIELDKDIFYSVLKRVSLINQESVRFNVLKDKFLLTAESDLGDVKEEIDIEYKGEEFNILFNPRYIFDCLRNISDNKIIFAVSNNIDKGIMKLPNNPNFIYIIMPIRE